jgi:hypothetical protein
LLDGLVEPATFIGSWVKLLDGLVEDATFVGWMPCCLFNRLYPFIDCFDFVLCPPLLYPLVLATLGGPLVLW